MQWREAWWKQLPVLLPASASEANSVAWGEQILKVAESTVNEMILKEMLKRKVVEVLKSERF